ncbi:MAG: hypothetical protein O7F73_18775 [Gammaproteobacteria bacterium]|nr:hypothetical protein [Gammaproteobacteria bacterium]
MDLEGRGIPSGYILTEEFREADQAQAKSLGYDAMKVFVEHPIQDRNDAEMEVIAEQAFAEVVAMICSSDQG